MVEKRGDGGLAGLSLLPKVRVKNWVAPGGLFQEPDGAESPRTPQHQLIPTRVYCVPPGAPKIKALGSSNCPKLWGEA